ncbi:MAG: DUF5808 domain-containing protein [Ktedonobacterales bacterium]
MGKLNTFTAGVIAGLVAAAIGQELAKEPGQRTWKGKVAGIPYNFRLAEWSNIASEYWNPESNHIITPHVIGMGWGINFAAALQWLQKISQANTSEVRPTPLPPHITEPVDR